MPENKDRLIRLRQVLNLIPVSRSTWYAGVKSGKYPAGIKIGSRMRAYRESEINALMEKPWDEK